MKYRKKFKPRPLLSALTIQPKWKSYSSEKKGGGETFKIALDRESHPELFLLAQIEVRFEGLRREAREELEEPRD